MSGCEYDPPAAEAVVDMVGVEETGDVGGKLRVSGGRRGWRSESRSGCEPSSWAKTEAVGRVWGAG